LSEVAPLVNGLDGIRTGFRQSVALKVLGDLERIDALIHQYGRGFFLPVGGGESEEPDWDVIRARGGA